MYDKCTTGSKSVNTIQSSVNRVQAIHGFFPIFASDKKII